MKATQLDVVINILDDCVKQITSTKSKMEIQKSICDKHKETERVANEKLQRLQSLEPLKVSWNLFINKLICLISRMFFFYAHCRKKSSVSELNRVG